MIKSFVSEIVVQSALIVSLEPPSVWRSQIPRMVFLDTSIDEEYM